MGGACIDSCCVGWSIDIDKTTFRQYHKVKDADMKKMFQKNVHNNEHCTCDDIDYGQVKLAEDKRCPFLDDKNYCVIHSNLGEEYLSNVCTSFPRITNKVDGLYEFSLDVSCPEAARILLLKEDGIEFEERKESLGKHIVSVEINTKNKDSYLPVEHFNAMREVSIQIVQDRNYSIDERLYILGEFINDLENEAESGYDNLESFIKNYDIEFDKESLSKNTMNYILQIDFFNKILGLIDIEKEIDSDKFKELTKIVRKSFNLENFGQVVKEKDFYIDKFEEYNKEVIEKNSYIFENYLVNFIYSNMFPFSEVESIFDGYIMLLMRYEFIKFYLIGMYINDNKQDVVDIVGLIQLFSKVVGHHRSYTQKILKHIKKNELDNINFMENILLVIE
ncbi:MAG: flagellin lysine-N-methylase [Sarcina sp.]